MNFKQEIEAIEKIIKECELKKAALSKEVEINHAKCEELKGDIRKMGYAPEEIEEAIVKIESEVKADIEKAKAELGV